MQKAISILLLLALTALYVFALPVLLSWWNRIAFPWLPFAGHTGPLLYLRLSIPYLLAVLTLALPVGAGIALRFAPAPFRFGLLPGLLPAANMLRLLLTHTFTGLMQWMIAKDALLVLLLPACIAWLFARLIRRWRARGGDAHSTSTSLAQTG